MSRRENCWDNAPQESFLAHMKNELASEISEWNLFKAAKVSTDRWMDYYNNDRCQCVGRPLIFCLSQNRCDTVSCNPVPQAGRSSVGRGHSQATKFCCLGQKPVDHSARILQTGPALFFLAHFVTEPLTVQITRGFLNRGKPIL